MSESYWHLPLSEAMKINTQKVCKIDGCERNRVRVSSWCNYHTQRTNRSGHPLGSLPSRARFRFVEREVKELFEMNPSHPGIAHGVAFFEKWLADAMEGKDTPAAKAICYIAERGADPQDLFTLICAMYTRQGRETSPFINHKNFLLAIGYRVCRHMGMPGNTIPKRRHTWDVGNHINKEIGPLCVRITYAVDELWRNKEEVKKKALISFNTEPDGMVEHDE